MRTQRRPVRLAAVVNLADRAGARRRAAAVLSPEIRASVTSAAEAAAALFVALAARGDAHAILRVAEALCELGEGKTTRSTRILDEVLSAYRAPT